MHRVQPEHCARQASRLRKGWSVAVATCACGRDHDQVKLVVSPSGKQFPVPTRESSIRIVKSLAQRNEFIAQMHEIARDVTLVEFKRWLATKEHDEESYGVVCAVAIGVEDHAITWADLGITNAHGVN